MKNTNQSASKNTGVMSPWKPVSTRTSVSGIDVDVLGRTYRFHNSLLPTSIRTAGTEILASPMRLAGTLDGEAIRWTKQGVLLIRKTREKAVLSGTLSNSSFIVNTTCRVEFDGCMRVDLVLAPTVEYLGMHASPTAPASGQIQNLVLEVPLKPEYASLFHYWPGQWGSAENSGGISEGGLRIPFKPHLWLGWEEGGLSWFAESERGWQPQKEDCVLEVVRKNREVVLRLHLLDSPPQAFPLTVTFGFQATPIKPVPKDFHEWNICHEIQYEMLHQTVAGVDGKKEKVLDYLKRSGVKTVVFSEYWTPILNYWETNREEELKQLVAECHKRGIRFLLYFGYVFSSMTPEWAELMEEVVVKDAHGKCELHYQPRYKGALDQMCCRLCYNNQWQDRMVKGVEAAVKRFNADGIFLDGTIEPWQCANEKHGCGYRAPDGSLHGTYPIFAVRNLMRRLYQVVHRRGGIINAHQSSDCMVPMLSFCDCYWDGEQFQGGELSGDPLKRLPLDAFRAEFMGKNFGVPCDFLVYPRPPDWTVEHALAFTLLHDVNVRPFIGIIKPAQGLQPESVKMISGIWKLLSDFRVSRAEWHPYWRNGKLITVGPESAKVSFYVNRKRLLLVVSNLSAKQEVMAKVAVNTKALGFGKGFKSAYDPFTRAEYPREKDTLQIALPPMRAKWVWIDCA